MNYIILRGISFLYKIFAVLSVLIALGGVGFLLIDFVGLPELQRIGAARTALLQQITITLIFGVMGCLLFGTLAQLIDVTVSTNQQIQQIALEVRRQTKKLDSVSVYPKIE